jgi:predicted metal-dependent peptidase
MARPRGQRRDPRQEILDRAWTDVRYERIFAALMYDPTQKDLPVAHLRRQEETAVTRTRGWARVHPDGLIEVNPLRHGTVEEWTWVLAHCLLHLGFGHLDGPVPDRFHATACCVVVARFQQALRLGEPPAELPSALPSAPEDALAERWRDTGVPEEWAALAIGGADPDLVPATAASGRPALSWGDRLSIGLSAVATSAVEEAGQHRHRHAAAPDPHSAWERARRWFVSSYPLMAALATGFTIVADLDVARSLHIGIAAVDAERAEIYVNPLCGLSEEELRFVLAHEMLHAALRHQDRTGGRDAYLWNVAADYVINGWLIEMGVGEMPEGLLYDPELKGMSTEAVYDLIARDLRRMRRLATLRGRGAGDMLDGTREDLGRGRVGDAVGLDEFYRRALVLGLEHHRAQGRGLVSVGLEEEIRVLDHPPIPWEAELAKWFDVHVPAVQKRRSYARPSRRQASTPHIPRPGWYLPEQPERRVTFGVVLDTSGSMGTQLMGKALGAIASFSRARDVPAARVIYCDAVAYDAGYVPVEEIAGRVRVRGRGGTVLQPAVTLLERAVDFPADGPILVITDGQCDALRIRREHAYLVPAGAQLPFRPRGPVFSVR